MKDSPEAPRILLVDDHPAVRQGLALVLSRHDFLVVGEAERRPDTLELVSSQRPDLVVVDLSLKNESGLDLLCDLREMEVPALVYSMHEEPQHIKRAFASGAQGYVTKCEVSQVLIQAVREVLAGNRYVSPQAAQSLAGSMLSDPAPDAGKTLSPREETIFGLVGRGEDAARIAAALNVSIRTVESYCNRIIVKLELTGMKELRRLAIGKNSASAPPL